MIKRLKQFTGNFSKVLFMYKLIWRIDKKYVLLFPVNILINAVSPLILVIIPKLIIDEITGERRFMTLLGLAGLLIAANLFIRLINAMYEAYHSKKSDDIKSGLYFMLQEKAMKMDYEYLENPKILDSLQKANEIISPTKAGYMDFRAIINCCNAIVSNLMTISGFIAIISSLSWILFAAIFVVILVNLFLNSYVRNKEYEVWKLGLMPITRKLGYLQDISTNNAYAKEVRIYNLSAWINNKLKELTKNLVKNYLSMVPSYFGVAVVSNTLRALQEGGVYLYIGYRCLKGSISIGDFTMYINAVMNLTQTLNSITNHIITINKSGLYLEEFISFLNLSGETGRGEDTGGGKAGEESGHSLEFKNVWFRYPGQEEYTLKDISITIRPNEKLAIVGDNGAGKTTFIKLLLRLYRPDRGEILLDGRNINEYGSQEYMRCFCAVFQDFQTLAFSVLENIAYDGADTCSLEEIRQILESMKLSEKISSLPHELHTLLSKLFDKEGLELSGGEQQKIALCNCIYRRAPVIILDEPTAMLSPAMEYELYDNFDQIVHKKTAVYISHRMSICRFCDNIAVFSGGRIVEYGSHFVLIRQNGLYTEMYNAQAQYYVDLKKGAV
jgi:ABC-type multidrug transport system fused ATPase/permease subunit